MVVLDKDIVTVLYVFESVVKVTAISASWPYVSTPRPRTNVESRARHVAASAAKEGVRRPFRWAGSYSGGPHLFVRFRDVWEFRAYTGRQMACTGVVLHEAFQRSQRHSSWRQPCTALRQTSARDWPL